MEHLINAVQDWSKEKGLDKTNPDKQFLKIVEEVGEVGGELARGNDVNLIGEIGDVFVTLIILCQQKGIAPDYALLKAYEKISKRKGEMVNGVFIKEEDL